MRSRSCIAQGRREAEASITLSPTSTQCTCLKGYCVISLLAEAVSWASVGSFFSEKDMEVQGWLTLTPRLSDFTKALGIDGLKLKFSGFFSKYWTVYLESEVPSP